MIGLPFWRDAGMRPGGTHYSRIACVNGILQVGVLAS
jgi:hypothetical protein